MSWAAASQIVETESLLGEKSCRFPHRTEVPGGRKVCVQHSLHGNSGGHHTQGTTSHTPVNVQKSSPGVGFALLPIPRRVSFYASFSSLQLLITHYDYHHRQHYQPLITIHSGTAQGDQQHQGWKNNEKLVWSKWFASLPLAKNLLFIKYRASLCIQVIAWINLGQTEKLRTIGKLI